MWVREAIRFPKRSHQYHHRHESLSCCCDEETPPSRPAWYNQPTYKEPPFTAVRGRRQVLPYHQRHICFDETFEAEPTRQTVHHVAGNRYSSSDNTYCEKPISHHQSKPHKNGTDKGCIHRRNNSIFHDLCHEFDRLVIAPPCRQTDPLCHNTPSRDVEYREQSRQTRRCRSRSRLQVALLEKVDKLYCVHMNCPDQCCSHKTTEYLMSGGRGPGERISGRERRHAGLVRDEFGIWHECDIGIEKYGGRRDGRCQWCGNVEDDLEVNRSWMEHERCRDQHERDGFVEADNW